MTSSRPFAWAAAWAAMTLFAASAVLADLPDNWKDGLVDGERVALLGNTLIEREQRDGYLETMLTAAYHDRNVTFRNLGWSGDNVYGRSPARFGNVDEGWRHLNESLDLVKPTAVIICYGFDEAYAGEQGLDDFRKGYLRLLETVGRHTKKIMLLSPPPLEDLGRPLPDPAQQNANLAKYGAAIRELAYDQQCAFVDLYAALGDKQTRGVAGQANLTSNGVHLTDYGYWEAARAIRLALGKATPIVAMDRQSERTASIPLYDAIPAPLESVSLGKVTQDATVDFKIAGSPVASGKVDLSVDGEKLGTYTPEQLQAGINVPKLADAAEALRKEIVAKNELFFHRYRPQNETYLFLFRKHEQGNNAVEIPQFDPLIAAKESTIAKLRQPQELKLTLAPAK